MGRKAINGQAMTAAQRQARRRENDAQLVASAIQCTRDALRCLKAGELDYAEEQVELALAELLLLARTE